MADPLARNRLDGTASPYLHQHADNPVNWQPWDETALSAAEERDKPIFLSVGYAACHWCHVMAEESFENEAVAEVLNERYVPIKVDREERPDVDRIYQTICQLVTRGGGWPLSAWLTPDGRPFYVGTYFPLEGRGNQPGFLELIAGLADTWEADRSEVDGRADQWSDAITSQLEDGGASTPGVDQPGFDRDDEDPLETAAGSAVRSADREYGGFGTSGPKFPQPSRLRLLLRWADRGGDDAAATVADEALDAMRNGALFDHLGGGFHRYATDREWRVPHFEKMLYDNAALPMAYIDGERHLDREEYRSVVADTLDFVDRELGHPSGGFYSTLDAQSSLGGERVEGAYYTWTVEEVRDAVGDDTAATAFIERYGIGNTGSVAGRSTIGIETDLGAIAESLGTDIGPVESALERAHERLRTVRSERDRPPRDEKVLAGWNGLAIEAFAEAGLTLGQRYTTRAKAALGFVRNHHWDGERLSRRYLDGDVGVTGYLDDYAALASGALSVHGATGELEPLAFALSLAEVIVEEFWDGSGLYYTPESGETLLARPQELTDQSTPSSAGIAIDTLLALDHFRPDDRFATVARSALETYRDRIRADPLQHATLALAADRDRVGSTELTIVAEERPAGWLERIGETYLEPKLLTWRPSDLDPWLDRLGYDAAPPIWADRPQSEDGPTVYTCRNFTCSPPTGDIEEALAWAAEGLTG